MSEIENHKTFSEEQEKVFKINSMSEIRNFRNIPSIQSVKSLRFEIRNQMVIDDIIRIYKALIFTPHL